MNVRVPSPPAAAAAVADARPVAHYLKQRGLAVHQREEALPAGSWDEVDVCTLQTDDVGALTKPSRGQETALGTCPHPASSLAAK
jgi:hypothetical protein